jgi:ribosomal protein L40E
VLICGECGATNEDGEDFCGECGSYLDWDAQPVSTESAPAEPEPAAEPEPEPAAPGFAERVKSAVGLGKAEEAAPAAEPGAPAAEPGAQAAEKAAAPGDEPPAAEKPAAPAEAPAAEAGADDRQPANPAASLVVRTPPEKKPAAPKAERPPAAQKTAAQKTAAPKAAAPKAAAPKTAAQKPAAQMPGAPSPAAVRPGAAAPKARRPAARVEEPPPAPGDLICGKCGAGNKPTRKFCRRCGADLVDAPVAQYPWWKRWFKGRVKAPPTAGARPAQTGRRVPTGLLVVAVVVAVLAAAAWFGRGLVSPAYQAVLDRVMGTDPVNPTRLTASSSAPGAGPERARDGLSNRFWAPAPRGDGAGEWLQARFGEPTRVVYVVVLPGVSSEEEAFLKKGRPKDVELRLVSADGTRKIEDVTLDDEPGAQQFNVATSDVRAVRMTIKSAYPGSDPGSRVAVAELEFRGR